MSTTNGFSMRISFADSRTNGFKKWSDAQRPTDTKPPGEDLAADDPAAQQQANGLSPAGCDRAGK